MENPSHYTKDEIPGALGLGQTMATRLYCAFFICHYLTPTLVAPLADSFLGQYNTLLISILTYCCGCIALTVSAVPVHLDRGWGLPGFIIAMVLIAIGSGAVSPVDASILTTSLADSIRVQGRPDTVYWGPVSRNRPGNQDHGERRESHHRVRAYIAVYLQPLLLGR